MRLSRRSVLGSALAAGLPGLASAQGKGKQILLRSSWQTVNIGDIGHTPGLLRLLERHVPEARVTLWPSSVDRGVGPLLLKEFPKLRIAEGRIGPDGKPTTPELRAAFEAADLLLHGSGPSVVGQAHLEAWRKQTGKPYGIYGVTIGAVSPALRDLLSGAAFVYCRDTLSLELIRKEGVRSPVMEFGPDATFAIHLRDDRRAEEYLRASGLKRNQYLCAIPRLRYTPYYKIHGRAPTETDREREAYSERFKEADHAKQREAIVQWVRRTGLKVLACPEMTYQVPLAKEVLVDPLPPDVKRNVVWRDTYWLPDEAASIYARARVVLSAEMHSPIIAAANDTPAIYLRQPTDTSKGQMWRDIGLDQWIFEIDAATGQGIAERVLEICSDTGAADAKLDAAMDRVRERQRSAMGVIRRTLG